VGGGVGLGGPALWHLVWGVIVATPYAIMSVFGKKVALTYQIWRLKKEGKNVVRDLAPISSILRNRD